MHLGINDGDTRGAMPWDIYNRAAVICQIESKVGAENADAISAIEGGESAGPQYTALLAHPSVLRGIPSSAYLPSRRIPPSAHLPSRRGRSLFITLLLIPHPATSSLLSVSLSVATPRPVSTFSASSPL